MKNFITKTKMNLIYLITIIRRKSSLVGIRKLVILRNNYMENIDLRHISFGFSNIRYIDTIYFHSDWKQIDSIEINQNVSC